MLVYSHYNFIPQRWSSQKTKFNFNKSLQHFSNAHLSNETMFGVASIFSENSRCIYWRIFESYLQLSEVSWNEDLEDSSCIFEIPELQGHSIRNIQFYAPEHGMALGGFICTGLFAMDSGEILSLRLRASNRKTSFLSFLCDECLGEVIKFDNPTFRPYLREYPSLTRLNNAAFLSSDLLVFQGEGGNVKCARYDQHIDTWQEATNMLKEPGFSWSGIIGRSSGGGASILALDGVSLGGQKQVLAVTADSAGSIKIFGLPRTFVATISKAADVIFTEAKIRIIRDSDNCFSQGRIAIACRAEGHGWKVW